MSHGWAGVTPKRLSELDSTQFEGLCYDLIVFEARDRGIEHRPQGPAGTSTRDGGRDILLTITKQSPEPASTYCQQYQVPSFIGDVVGDIAYSCKTSSGSRSSWLTLVLRDIEKYRAPRPVEVLRAGGQFKILISELSPFDATRTHKGKEAKPIVHIVDALWEQMKRVDQAARRPIEGVDVELLGPHLIVDFLRGRQPTKGGLANWLDVFNLRLPLRNLANWGGLHAQERTAPRFTLDAKRTQITADIKSFISASQATPRDRVAWLVGPPGVGKTRLMLEALNDPAVTQRAQVALNFQEFREALDTQRLLEQSPEALIIVDDCTLEQAQDAVNHFVAANRHPGARLIVITPAAARTLQQDLTGRRWELPALEQAALLTLVGNITGGALGPEDTGRIASLSQGYPWFATLLADEALLRRSVPASLRQATHWALASSDEATGIALQTLYMRRARCLLAVILTESVDWDEMPDESREQLLQAVGLDRWTALREIANDCVSRGVLRRSSGWKYKYVTPAVLAREILEWLLGADGPDPGGKTLQRRGATFAGPLFAALNRLGVSASVTQRIAKVTLEDMRTEWANERVEQMTGALRAQLEFSAQEMPLETAHVLRLWIEAHSLGELRSNDGDRRSLVEVLDALTHRRGAFEDAEAGLFRLAQAENEGYANNATGLWSRLFIPELHQSHVTLDELVALLKRRLTAADLTARGVALSGVERMLSSDGYTFRVTPVDGPWPVVETFAALAARVEIWRSLLVQCSDPQPSLAERARRIVHEELRSAVRMGLGADALAAVADALDAWDMDQRVHLVEAVDEIHAYEFDQLDEQTRAALENLSSRLAPESYGARLRQLVGRWGHAWLKDGPIVFDQPDRALAREGLAGARPVLAELHWLASDAAVRGHLFAEALGHEDSDGHLLARLIDLGAQWREQPRRRALLARYVGGAARAGHTALVELAFREVRTIEDEPSLLALVALDVGLTDDRLYWLIPATTAAALDMMCVRELARWPQTFDAVGSAALLAWIDALMGGPPEYVAAALDAMWWRTKRRPSDSDEFSSRLLAALGLLTRTTPPEVDAHHWEAAAKHLVGRGHPREVAQIAVAALCQGALGVLGGSAWNGLNAVFESEPVCAWETVAAALIEGRPETVHLLSALDIHRASRHWRADVVLAWVGDDPWRGWAIASVMRPHAAKLHPIVRGLVQRFGPDGRVADELAARVHSPGRAVASLAEHDEQQIKHVNLWTKDPNPDVRVFAERLLRSLKASHERYAAYEEHERRRWGT